MDSDTSSEELNDSVREADDWDDWGATGGEGEGDEMDEQQCRSLFDTSAFPTPEEAFDYDAAQHGFDLRAYVAERALNDYDCIKAVNFIRAAVAEGRDPKPELLQPSTALPFQDDRWLAPVLEDDGLMFFDFQGEEEDKGTQGMAAFSLGAPIHCQGASTSDVGASSSKPGTTPSEALSVAALLEENRRLREALEGLKWAVLPEELREESAGGSEAAVAKQAKDTSATPKLSPEQDRVDRSYFDSYSYFDIHREMLGDRHRTETYRAALEKNPTAVSGKRVLDVGCGTGILSMFAARGGAASVVGVDGSERIAGFARKVVELNGHGPSGSGKVTVVSGKVEELGSLPGNDQGVDIIVSEWMGYALLFETMLDSVFAARDRWLRPGGSMMPDRASIFIAAGGRGASGLSFWDDVYGFDMAPIKEQAHASSLKGAVVRVVSPSDLLTKQAEMVKEWDLLTASVSDLDFTAEFQLSLEDAPASEALASLVLWFDTAFSDRVCPDKPVVLTTSAHTTPTHWAQTVLPLREAISLDGIAAVSGRISFAARKGACRSLDIAVECWPILSDGSQGPTQSSLYNMGVNQGNE